MPKWRYQGGDSTCGDGAGKYAKRKKPADIGRGCEMEESGGAGGAESKALSTTSATVRSVKISPLTIP